MTKIKKLRIKFSATAAIRRRFFLRRKKKRRILSVSIKIYSEKIIEKLYLAVITADSVWAIILLPIPQGI